MAYKRKYNKRRKTRKRVIVKCPRPMKRGEMMVSYEVDVNMQIEGGGSSGVMYVGDHPALGAFAATNIPTVDDKWISDSTRFQYFKPTGVRIKYNADFNEANPVITNIDPTSGNTTVNAVRVNFIDYIFDMESTSNTYETSWGTDPIAFNNWIEDKEYNKDLQPYKNWTIYRKDRHRIRTEADGTVVKRLAGGYLSNNFTPAFGYHIFFVRADAVFQANTRVGTCQVVWYGVLKTSGDLAPPI